MDKRYFETVQLLLDVAPLIFRGGDFAMKGGTAINLFHRDMPRLSVDIDVVYIHGDRVREEALGAISQALDRAATELERRGLGRIITYGSFPSPIAASCRPMSIWTTFRSRSNLRLIDLQSQRRS